MNSLPLRRGAGCYRTRTLDGAISSLLAPDRNVYLNVKVSSYKRREKRRKERKKRKKETLISSRWSTKKKKPQNVQLFKARTLIP